MTEAYLTIDDTPSDKTGEVLVYLDRAGIQGLFFVRGDQIERQPGVLEDVIAAGHVIGNHTYSHQRASTLPYDEVVQDIERCESLIDKAYKNVKRSRSAPYFRFPHMDRGTGGYVVDYDAYDAYKEDLVRLFTDGLNVALNPPTAEQTEKKAQLQEYLAACGVSQPFNKVTFDWFTETEMASARDCMFTFSNSDWMLTKRHLDRDWPYKTLDDLKAKIDTDPFFENEKSAHIILMHDQTEIVDVALDLLTHMRDKKFKFLEY